MGIGGRWALCSDHPECGLKIFFSIWNTTFFGLQRCLFSRYKYASLFTCCKYTTLQSLIMDRKSTENTITIYIWKHHRFAISSWVILNQSIGLYWTNPSIFVRPVFVVVWTESRAIVYDIFTHVSVICVLFELVHKINFGCSFSSSHAISLWKTEFVTETAVPAVVIEL
jgi:hypothetical protein